MPRARRFPTLGRRFWLHGDIAADGRAFCRICANFDVPLHFESHGNAANLKLYQAGVAALELLSRSARVILGARKNLFAAGAA